MSQLVTTGRSTPVSPSRGARRPRREEHDGGFTLIELLVVMIILGILAAIVIPTMLAQKAKARDASAKADAANVALGAMSLKVDHVDNLRLTQVAGSQDYTLTATRGAATETTTGHVSPGNRASLTYDTARDTFCATVATTDGDTFSAGDTGGVVKGSVCP